MQVGASPTDRIINHVQVKCTALPGAELQQCLCCPAYHPLGQGNAHRRAILSCPDGCRNAERHFPGLHPVCWEHQGMQSLTCSCMVFQVMVLQKIDIRCLPFLSIQRQLLRYISRRARLSYEKNMCESIRAACIYFSTKGSGTKTLKGNKPLGL